MTRWLVAALIVLSAVPVWSASDMPGWYIFYSTGRAPDRSLYIVDARYQKVSSNVYQTRALVMRETPKGDFDHWSGTLQYQAEPDEVALARGPLETLQPLLKTVRVRTLSSYQMHANGKVVPGQPTEWSPFKSPIDVLGFRIATDPGAMDNPGRYGMVFAGNFHRPIDVVDLVRRVLPNVKHIEAGVGSWCWVRGGLQPSRSVPNGDIRRVGPASNEVSRPRYGFWGRSHPRWL